MAKFCYKCGNTIKEGAVFCENCGVKLDSPTSVQPEQAQIQPCGDSHTQPSQQPQQSHQSQQPQQQTQKNIPYQQSAQSYPQYGNQQPPKKITRLSSFLSLSPE